MWGSAIFLSSCGRKHLAPDRTGSPRGSITRPAERWTVGAALLHQVGLVEIRKESGNQERSTGSRYNGAMKFLFDLFPVALFFVAFKLFDIYAATAVAIGATLLQIGWLKWKRRKVDTMMWISLGIILLFCGAT